MEELSAKLLELHIPFEYDGAYHVFGEGHWGYIERLGSARSGFKDHKGRPGQRGGSVARGVGYQYAKNRDEWVEKAETNASPPEEVYRWVNLQEIHDMFLGKRTRSLDVTEDPDWYFAPSKILKSKSFVGRTYGRLVLDGQKLADAGWKRDSSLFGEMAWRAYGDPRTQDDKHVIQSFMGAIKKLEIIHNPTGENLEDLQAWLDFRIGYHVDIVKGPHYTEEEFYLSEPNLALSLQEMGFHDSISYLIEHDYHFRTAGEKIVILGSSKSGHYRHKGIPGHRGGSAASGTGVSSGSLPGTGVNITSTVDKVYERVKDEEYPEGSILRAVKEGEITFDQASEIFDRIAGSNEEPKKSEKGIVTADVAVRDLKLPDEVLERNDTLTKVEQRWTSGADPEAKEDIVRTYEIFPELKELRLYQMYGLIGKEGQTFDEFKNVEVTLWRGGLPTYGSTFSTFTLSRGVAEDFAEKHGGGVYELKIKPSDLVGYAPTGASEAFVPPVLSSTEDFPEAIRLSSENNHVWYKLGGEHSGHYRHKGVPGQRGGSAPGPGILQVSSYYQFGSLPGEAAGVNLVHIAETVEGKKVIKSMDDESQLHEVQAYQISELLGLSVVPKTEIRTVEILGEGIVKNVVVQDFVSGVTAAQLAGRIDPETQYSSDDGMKIAILDRVTLQSDRHVGNWMLGDKGLVAIDNEQWVNPRPRKDSYLSARPFVRENLSKPIPTPILSTVRSITRLQWEKVMLGNHLEDSWAYLQQIKESGILD